MSLCYTSSNRKGDGLKLFAYRHIGCVARPRTRATINSVQQLAKSMAKDSGRMFDDKLGWRTRSRTALRGSCPSECKVIWQNPIVSLQVRLARLETASHASPRLLNIHEGNKSLHCGCRSFPDAACNTFLRRTCWLLADEPPGAARTLRRRFQKTWTFWK